MRAVWIGILAFGQVVLLLAEARGAEGTNPRLTDLTAVGRVAEAQETAKPPGFAEWSTKIELAKHRRESSKLLFWIGLGTAVVVPFLGLAVHSGDGGASNAIAVIGGLGGAGLATYGGLKAKGAAEEIDDLDREGRTKGYLTHAPRARGLEVAFSWRF